MNQTIDWIYTIAGAALVLLTIFGAVTARPETFSLGYFLL